MAFVVKDRVRQTTTTTGTGAVTLSGSVTGFQSFSVIGNGNNTYYAIVDSATGDWEVGTGTYTSSGTSLSRDSVLDSSNSGNLVPFGTGVKDVFVTYPAGRSVYITVSGGVNVVTVSGTVTSNQSINVNNAVTVASNAGTVPVTYKLNTFTNSSAATMTITLATASAVDGQMSIVRIYDFSAVSQTISWVNTENSNVSVPTASNGSTTLPLTVGFMYNGQTSKWRCIASA